jgi:predicted Rossmann fold nucleotide-binding protein DprA/Smf involved in DNA uptake
LREKQLQPADLIGVDSAGAIAVIDCKFGRARIESLLARGFLLSQAIERWSARAIWIVSRADPEYPRRLKSRLKENAPPILYGCGDIALLENGGLAVVGSRHVDEALTSYTEELGRVVAGAKRTLISGAAKGIDKAAMHGALRAGGSVIGVMADSLERAALARDNREPLMDQRLVFISAYDPVAGFNVGHAMQRNKVIYALADAALVVTSDFQKGGTWTGAIEQLERLRFVPVFVRSGNGAGAGNSALLQRGARLWPEPSTSAELDKTLTDASDAMLAEPKQEKLSFTVKEEVPPTRLPPSKREQTLLPADRLFETVESILTGELAEPHSETQVMKILGVSKAQTKKWLQQLVERGAVEKLKKPVRYRAVGTPKLL